MDSIALEGMIFYGFHGVSAEEQALGQRFVVDLDAHVDLRRAGASDQIQQTVSYSHLYHMVKEVVEGPRRNLLEAVAEAIAVKVLSESPITSVRVRVRKPSPPIRGAVLDSASVTIFRARAAPPPMDEL
ncbi:MAG: dihydroneopterin aldolase [SAR202 cluster bacterium]|nr:dihydroneopterin aldolase [SAR202 cluster bacterium]